ncbi:unnamed protein product [Arabidopsis thaliana]|nr:unnamed protein product [Arabidopsis thaliana]
MVESELSYEQIRLNRVEENKKRMGELNLNKLAQSLRVSSSSSSSSKPSPAKPRTMRIPVDFSEVRRSSRAKVWARTTGEEAKKVDQSTLSMNTLLLLHYLMSSRRRDLLNRVYASDDARMYAFDRAEKLQSSLDSEYASFTKPMLQSHVTGGFWLGLPLPFCKAHMPKRDVIMTLVDEEEEESQAKYLAQKNGLSGGWRGFAIDHQLVDGDAVVFHLIARTTFKVYIIRVNDDANNDSDGNEVNDDDSDGNEEDRDNDNESNEKQKETVSEGRQLRSSGKRKRRVKLCNEGIVFVSCYGDKHGTLRLNILILVTTIIS